MGLLPSQLIKVHFLGHAARKKLLVNPPVPKWMDRTPGPWNPKKKKKNILDLTLLEKMILLFFVFFFCLLSFKRTDLSVHERLVIIFYFYGT